MTTFETTELTECDGCWILLALWEAQHALLWSEGCPNRLLHNPEGVLRFITA
jgi:hypothetical protein